MRYSLGQLKMQLASQLHGAGMGAMQAFNCAIDIVDAKSVPPNWRKIIGSAVADAIDADLKELMK